MKTPLRAHTPYLIQCGEGEGGGGGGGGGQRRSFLTLGCVLSCDIVMPCDMEGS